MRTLKFMPFMDAWNLERLKNCFVHVAHADGRMIPFCTNYLTYKDGVNCMTEDVRITDEAMEVYKSRVGKELHVNQIFNDNASLAAIRRYCDGIGEGNTLFRDPGYAATTLWRGLIAPPSFVMSVFPGWILQGLPGVHVFHSSSDFEFFAPIRMNDQIIPSSRFDGYRVLGGKLGRQSLLEIQTATYASADGCVFARAKVTGVRAERPAARDADIYKKNTLPHPWTQDELTALEDRELRERPRGGEPLFIEDIDVGDELPVLTKGPIGVSDIIAYCIGASPVRLVAHGLALEDFRLRPAWYFRDGDSCSLEPVFSVHYNHNAAQAVGMPYPYDLGSQRHAWLMQMLTNWIGDTGWLQRCQAKYSGFVFLSDAVTLRGEVTKIYANADRINCADVKTLAVNQRGEAVMKGTSTVLLPSKKSYTEVAEYIKNGG